MIDYRFKFLIFLDKEKVSLSYMSEKTGMSELEIIENIKSFNQVAQQTIGETITLKDEQIIVPKAIVKNGLYLLFDKDPRNFFINEEERRYLIYLISFAKKEELSIYSFQDIMKVSKNTVLKDIKQLREDLEKEGVGLNYTRKAGFYLEGNELTIRSIAYSYLQKLMNGDNGELVTYLGIDALFYIEIHQRLLDIIQSYQLSIVPSRLKEASFFITYLLTRYQQYELDWQISNKELIMSLASFQYSKELLMILSDCKISEEEICYITMIFMTFLQNNQNEASLDFLVDCASEMIYEIERLAAIQFKDFRALLLNLVHHLIPAFFRIEYQLVLENELIEEIKIQYAEMFELTKRALFPLKKVTTQVISDEEIGYLTILFGGEINSQRKRKDFSSLKALILCPSGISSSLIMKSELQSLFPQINFFQTNSIEQYNAQHSEEYDLIFSSVPVKTDKKLYVIDPILTTLEKNLLVRQIQEDFFLSKIWFPTFDDILDTVAPYIVFKNGMNRDKLYRLVEKKLNLKMKRKEDDRPMLSELLTEDMIEITDQRLDWEEAIALAAKPLLAQDYIEERYIDAMINKVKDYGPFIHIGQGIALPHARPEDGVHHLGMSLLKVEQPVLLLDEEKHAIHLFICLAAIDNETHLKALASLTKILSNKEKLNELTQAKTKQEIVNIILKGEDEK